MKTPPPSTLPPLDTMCIGSGPALVLAHGAGGGVQANFGPSLDQLAEKRTIVGSDYPGSGATPLVDGPLHLDDLADAVVAAAIGAGLESFAMSGVSVGAAVSVRAATRHPDRITALILTAGFAKPDALFDLRLKVWRDLARTGDRHALQRFLTLVASRDDAFQDIEPEQVDETIRQAVDTIPPGSDLQRDLVERVDIRADLAQIEVPTLVMAPTRDALVHPRQSKEIADGIAEARLVEIDLDHILMDPSPRPWVKETLAFLEEVGR